MLDYKLLKMHLSKEDIKMANVLMKRCPILLVIREIQVKTTAVLLHIHQDDWN